MSSDWDVIVVGAGICGLAAAYELARRDTRVVVLERAGIGAEQSAGLGRIFRVAHGQPRLCALALEAAAGWRRWEAELGAGRLLGDEGLVAAGPRAVADVAGAMDAAGAAWEPLDGRAMTARIPFLDPPWPDGLLDPAAGSLRIRRALQALARRVEVRQAEVVAAGDGAVRLAGGAVLRAGSVLVCAGTRTATLAATAGIGFEVRFFHHVRLTYLPRAAPAAAPACLTAPAGYGVPLGSTGRWAFGLEDEGEAAPLWTTDAADVAAAVRARHAAWLPEVLPGLDPHPVDEVRCVSVQAPWLDAGGDGFAAARRGRVVAFTGANLMKFGPVLGDRLARTVLSDEVHPDLLPARPPVAARR